MKKQLLILLALVSVGLFSNDFSSDLSKEIDSLPEKTLKDKGHYYYIQAGGSEMGPVLGANYYLGANMGLGARMQDRHWGYGANVNLTLISAFNKYGFQSYKPFCYGNGEILYYFSPKLESIYTGISVGAGSLISQPQVIPRVEFHLGKQFYNEKTGQIRFVNFSINPLPTYYANDVMDEFVPPVFSLNYGWAF